MAMHLATPKALAMTTGMSRLCHHWVYTDQSHGEYRRAISFPLQMEGKGWHFVDLQFNRRLA